MIIINFLRIWLRIQYCGLKYHNIIVQLLSMKFLRFSTRILSITIDFSFLLMELNLENIVDVLTMAEKGLYEFWVWRCYDLA